MGRRDDGDTSSVVTVSFDEDKPSKGALSQKKLDQLAAARESALQKRRTKQKDKLQERLNEMNRLLGSDMRAQTLERVAEAMMKQEKRLRDRQNEMTEQLIEQIQSFKEDLRSLKERKSPPVPVAPRPPSRPKPRPPSEASSTGSGRTLTLAM
eukprot:2948601-Prymnesium_polylepis.1